MQHLALGFKKRDFICLETNTSDSENKKTLVRLSVNAIHCESNEVWNTFVNIKFINTTTD